MDDQDLRNQFRQYFNLEIPNPFGEPDVKAVWGGCLARWVVFQNKGQREVHFSLKGYEPPLTADLRSGAEKSAQLVSMLHTKYGAPVILMSWPEEDTSNINFADWIEGNEREMAYSKVRFIRASSATLDVVMKTKRGHAKVSFLLDPHREDKMRHGRHGREVVFNISGPLDLEMIDRLIEIKNLVVGHLGWTQGTDHKFVLS